MRYVRNRRMKLGEVAIGDIEIDTRSRDDIPALLPGLRHPSKDKTLRSRLFALLERHILPGTDRRVGRPGMEMWRIPGMGVVKQGLGCDFDRLQEPGTTTTRSGSSPNTRMFGTGTATNTGTSWTMWSSWARNCWRRSTARAWRAAMRSREKSLARPLAGRCDSLLVKTDVRHPTDVSLLRNAVRCMVRETAGVATKHDVGKWRQWRHLTEGVRQRFPPVRVTGRAQPDDVEGCLALCRRMVLRAEGTLPELEACGVNISTMDTIRTCMSHAVRQIDQVDRRLLRGETIPHGEKVFSVFKPHTRWIPEGKAGCPVGPGVPVCVVEDHEGSSRPTRSCGRAATPTTPCRWSGRPRRGSRTSARSASTGASTVPRTGRFWMNCPLSTRCRRKDTSGRWTGSAGRRGSSPRCAKSTRGWSPAQPIWGTAAWIGSGRTAPTASPARCRSP